MGENNTPEHHQPPKTSRILGVAVPLVGLVAVLAGCLVAWNTTQATSIGWFAYAPLSNQVLSSDGMVFVSRGTQIGLAIAVAGLLVLTFWAGHTMGRRARRKQ